MSIQTILRFAILVGALGIPLAITAGSTSTEQTTVGQSPGKASDNGPPAPSFEILLYNPSPIVVPLLGNKDGTIALTINNNGKVDINSWSAFATLRNDSGIATAESEVLVSISPQKRLEKGQAREVQITFNLAKPLPKFDGKESYASESLSGFLFVSGDGQVINKSLQLIPGEASSQAKWLILVGLIIALVIGLVSVIRLRGKLGNAINIPDWSTGSLMTNLTIIGSVITALTSAWGLVKQPHLLQSGEYLVLSGLFAALVAIAPLLFNSIHFETESAPETEGASKAGYVWLFIVATTFTLWGAFGQYALIYYYLDEFARAHLLSLSGLYVFGGGMILAGILLFVYAVRTIYSMVIEPALLAPTEAASMPEAAVVAEPAVAAAVRTVPALRQAPAKRRVRLL